MKLKGIRLPNFSRQSPNYQLPYIDSFLFMEVLY